VAAPTAGLHFTNQVFGNLRQRNIRADYVTLHVGAGTFKPVKTAVIGDHEMHAEWIDVHQQVIEKIIGSLNENIIAVGTTSLRTLESLYWLGVKCIHQSSPAVNSIDNQLLLSQWEVYDLADMNIPVADSLKALLQWMKNNNMDRMMAKTQILIAPGYKFKIVKGLVTNFHQPQSTLLLLIAALIGSSWKRVYNYALENDFRFLSYGDGSLLWYKED
jgi:S-adenosylmethionine:tRNA ribosyltransferase-isomerase